MADTTWIMTTNFSQRTPSSTVASTTCSTRDIRRPSSRTVVAPSARRRKAWSSCLPRKSQIRQCTYMTRPTQTSSNALTKPSVRPNFRSEMRLDGRELVDLSRRIEGFGEDVEADLVADDVGIDGGAASAEEAAVHVIDDEE